ncbi:MAG: hypothetical protein J7621_11720 [Niastella sp.]|nr:hypothetical protein [Niastella sp.]
MLLLLLIIAFLNTTSQVRWNGQGGDGQWSTPANWSGNVVPGAGNDVLLDNSFIAGSYTVTLPAGNTNVTIRSLIITPAGGNDITAVLPATNTAAPGFTLTSSGTGLTINSGGVFRNASGAGSGTPINIAGTVWVGNGGRYIHNSSRSHVEIVAVLATAPGTATGIFEFDIPGTNAPIISFTNRTFGTLVLSATTAGVPRTYTANGNGPATIRGDLIIGDNVNFNINLNNSVIVHGNYEQHGGMLNLNSSSHNTVLQISKHFTQTKGVITESNNMFPIIELNGTSRQHITTASGISNSITFKVNNAAGIALQTPLSLPYKLELVNGQVITTASNLLTLQAACTVSADTLSSASFIDGPLKKEGLMAASQFLFPVGKGNSHRWLSLVNATGNYTVEFFRSSPRSISSSYHTSIHHISSIEHWIITADASPVPQAQVKLSFNDPNSGGVTDLAALRVVQLYGGTWANAGNTSCMGTPGSNGFVVSNMLHPLGSTNNYFTLASTTASFNPLLLKQHPLLNYAHTITGMVTPTITTMDTRLVLNAKKRAPVTLMISNMAGRTIQTIPVYLGRGNNSILIPAATLPAGTYVITVAGPEGVMQPLRFVKL